LWFLSKVNGKYFLGKKTRKGTKNTREFVLGKGIYFVCIKQFRFFQRNFLEFFFLLGNLCVLKKNVQKTIKTRLKLVLFVKAWDAISACGSPVNLGHSYSIISIIFFVCNCKSWLWSSWNWIFKVLWERFVQNENDDCTFLTIVLLFVMTKKTICWMIGQSGKQKTI
jgi:hypothetical protein